jgi:hypothetical protein
VTVCRLVKYFYVTKIYDINNIASGTENFPKCEALQSFQKLFSDAHAADVNFTNIAAFTRADCNSAKNTVNPSDLFVLLGSLHIKAAHKMLIKSTPVVNFINILLSTFEQIFLRQKITKPKCN